MTMMTRVIVQLMSLLPGKVATFAGSEALFITFTMAVCFCLAALPSTGRKALVRTASRSSNAITRNAVPSWRRSRATVMGADKISRTPAEIVRDAQRVYGADKPPWCQPWTIVGTGAVAISGSWAVFRGWTAPVAVLVTGGVLLWWYAFLVLYPFSSLYRDDASDGS